MRAEPMPEFIAFQAGDTEVAPAGYIVPGNLREIVVRLQAHGVSMVPISGSVEAEVFGISEIETADAPFQQRHEQAYHGEYRTETVQVPEGSFWVPVDQPLGRLTFTLLEPRSDDGFANWGFFGESLEAGDDYPILRSHQGR